MQGLEESYRLPPRTHNGGPPLDPETVRQGAVPGSTTANPQRGSYQIGSNPNVPPLRSQAAANMVITNPNSPGGARPHTLVTVEQNLEAIRQGRGDPRFAGFEKRSVNVPYENARPGSPARGVEIHYQYRPGDQSTADIKDATGSRPQNNSAQRNSPGFLSRAGIVARVLRGMTPVGMVIDAFRQARDVQI